MNFPMHETSSALKILAPTRYPWQFNGPRQSRHDILIRSFVPMNYLSKRCEGVTLFNPFPLARVNMIHAFNRIPLGVKPFLIGFESHLPRGFGIEGSWFFKAMRGRLASPQCRAIVAISQYARRQFVKQHAGFPEFDALMAKLHVRYPNLPVPEGPDQFSENGEFRLVFVGNHFGRKGGYVALRLAQLAHQEGLPISVDIVSALEVGAMSWTDPLAPGYFHQYEPLLSLPNVRSHGKLPNKEVLQLTARAHFSLLPTFSDSFGYSAIEAMINYTPVLATAQGALPEFITDGGNGILLPLAVDAAGEWVHIAHPDRASLEYATLYSQEIDSLAREALARLRPLLADRAAYGRMRQNARDTAVRLFSAADANRFWDDFYSSLWSGALPPGDDGR